MNARDAMADGGELTLATESLELPGDAFGRHPSAVPGRYVRLVVRDTGCGIPPEDLERVFEPFFTTKGHDHGLGIGLTTVYSIVRNHGGWIEVRSEVGEGAEFSVFLPAAGEEVRHRPTAGRVLLADRKPHLRAVAADLFGGLGYDVVAVGDPDELFARCRGAAEEVRLVVLDAAEVSAERAATLAGLRERHPDLIVLLASTGEPTPAAARVLAEPWAAALPRPFGLMDLAGALARLGPG
jgi:CheY-like chemotaxis protein